MMEQESIQSFLSLHPNFIEELFPRRAEKINAASATRKLYPIYRTVGWSPRGIAPLSGIKSYQSWKIP